MKIDPSLNHVNLMTHDMDRMVEFYTRTMGFRVGPRPPFNNEGTWLYLGDFALIHLVKTDCEPFNKDPKIAHFAFSGTGMSEFAAHLRELDVPHIFRAVPKTEIVQVVLRDPDRNVFEVLFDRSSMEGAEPYRWDEPMPT